MRSVYPGWQSTPFIYGPLATSLLLPLPASAGGHMVERQQAALELLASRVADAPVDDYYAGAWTSLTTATLNGDLASACTKIFRHGCPSRI